ncbi:Arc family DNA-binding protein [Neokomagataea anthophila]|uniref:Arc family DNA-binding protein n=1 Tax=Neokomagataea anthophila TaxID=2826925 RepID=A0ABS5E8A7_9PROT|nr:Arc family DNA-binding protein [Neokomagataea anthophila]MBR0560041.1 Arc family DNA-binding protein [Neokomagataea anthophila]
MSDSPTRSITIRIDAEVFQAMRESAAKNSRSMNAEISARLVASLNQDALWQKDPAWPMRDMLEQPRLSHKEQVDNAKRRMSIVMEEWSALSEGLSGLPDIMKSTIIRRLTELENERAALDKELWTIDPEYRASHS